MKKTAIAVLVLTAGLCPAFHAQADDPIVAQTLFSDGRTNTWTQADLVAALQLLNRKYHRETDSATGTKAGREAWHGPVVRTLVNTGELTRTTWHEDGMVFVDPFVSVSSRKSLPSPAMTNGVPVRLANARLRAATAKTTTNEVTVTVSASP